LLAKASLKSGKKGILRKEGRGFEHLTLEKYPCLIYSKYWFL